jgi:decaprenylphospho-beta-D-erythro-pentofuranosid-2-ulose 2-reductase
MTAHLKKGLLFASAGRVGRGIVTAMHGNRDVVYLPGFWRLIMAVIKGLPTALIKRMSL